MSGHLLHLHNAGHALTFRPTTDGREEMSWVFEHNKVASFKDRENFMIEALEEYIANGWDYIDPQLVQLPEQSIILSNDTTFDDYGNITKLGTIYVHPYGYASMFSRLWATGQLDIMQYKSAVGVITQEQAAARRWRSLR